MPYSTIRKILGWKECKSVSTANHRAKIIKWLTVLQSHAVASRNNLGLRGTDRGETHCALCWQERSWRTLKTLFKFGEEISAKWTKKTESEDLILNEMLALQPFKATTKTKIHFPTIFYVEFIDPLILAKNKPQYK